MCAVMLMWMMMMMMIMMMTMMASVCVRECTGITILLSLSVFQLIVAEMVPSTSMAVPLVGN